MKQGLNEELIRITEIMAQNSPRKLLTESSEVKGIFKVLDEIISPSDVKKFAARFGWNIEMPVEKFMKNFEAMLKLLGDGTTKSKEAWDAMITSARKVDKDIVFKDLDGNVIDFASKDGYSKFLEMPSGSWVTETRYFEDIGGELVEVSEKVYKEIIAESELYHSLPSFMRAPYATVERRLASELADGAEDAISELPVFLKEMHLFMKTGNISKGLRLAIIRSLRDAPYWKQFAEVMQLKVDGSTMRMIKNYADDNVEGVFKYLEFILRSPSIKNVGMSFLNGKAFKSFNSFARTIIADVAASGFWNYAMGAVILKPIIKRLRVIYSAGSIKAGLKADWGKAFIQTAVGWLLIGSIKAMQYDNKARVIDPFGWYTTIIEAIKGNCTGQDKVTDALTGKFFANASGTAPDADNKPCKGKVILQPAFVKVFQLKEEVVKAKCEKIYNALNTKSSEESKWFWNTTNQLGFDIPTVTKVFIDFFNLYDPDRTYFEQAFFNTSTLKTGERDMDIFKMSQIADYYETNYSSSLYDDAKKLDNWAKFFGRENPVNGFSDLKTAIDKLPYLAKGEADATFKTYDAAVKENMKYMLTYPRKIKEKRAGGLARSIDIRKCCQNLPCKCPAGCDLGGHMIGPDVCLALAALSPKILTIDQVYAMTFTELKTVYDEVKGVSTTNKCWLNPNPQGTSLQSESWNCELNEHDIPGCVKVVGDNGTYSSLEGCQSQCGN